MVNHLAPEYLNLKQNNIGKKTPERIGTMEAHNPSRKEINFFLINWRGTFLPTILKIIFPTIQQDLEYIGNENNGH